MRMGGAILGFLICLHITVLTWVDRRIYINLSSLPYIYIYIYIYIYNWSQGKYRRLHSTHLWENKFGGLEKNYIFYFSVNIQVWPYFVVKKFTLASKNTYLLTPWSRVLLEKLTGSAVSQEIPRIFGTRRFLTEPTSARHLSLSWANSIQSPQLPPTSWRSIFSKNARLLKTIFLRCGSKFCCSVNSAL